MEHTLRECGAPRTCDREAHSCCFCCGASSAPHSTSTHDHEVTRASAVAIVRDLIDSKSTYISNANLFSNLQIFGSAGSTSRMQTAADPLVVFARCSHVALPLYSPQPRMHASIASLLSRSRQRLSVIDESRVREEFEKKMNTLLVRTDCVPITGSRVNRTIRWRRV